MSDRKINGVHVRYDNGDIEFWPAFPMRKPEMPDSNITQGKIKVFVQSETITAPPGSITVNRNPPQSWRKKLISFFKSKKEPGD